MERDEPVSEADVLEQEEPVTGGDRPVDVAIGVDSDVPEADAREQAQVVDEDQIRVAGPTSPEVPEADWLEQSIVEPIDDEER